MRITINAEPIAMNNKRINDNGKMRRDGEDT